MWDEKKAVKKVRLFDDGDQVLSYDAWVCRERFVFNNPSDSVIACRFSQAVLKLRQKIEKSARNVGSRVYHNFLRGFAYGMGPAACRLITVKKVRSLFVNKVCSQNRLFS